jgi:hypothetical protein
VGVRDFIAHAWSAWTQVDQDRLKTYGQYGASYGSRPDRLRFTGDGKSIISSIYNRIGIDAAAIDINHVRLNDNGEFESNIDSLLNRCLTVEANIDQAARAFRQDIFMTMFDKGTVAIVPIDTTLDPTVSAAYDIKTMRVGEIVAWFPGHVRVLVYNEKSGRREEITLSKDYVAIVENPLYTVMNEPNGTLQRLIRKLGQLDSIDEQASSGKLDLIIQLPYVIKTDARKEQAEARRKDIEMQLSGSKYGIAYTDGTERITQLNRSVENNMQKQVEYLTTMLYGQLGLTESVFNGSADEAEMLNYYNRTLEPILTAVVEAMRRTFLSKTALSQKQSIKFFRDPFKLVPVGVMAEIADKFSRNEIMTANEIRVRIGMKPSPEPKSNMLQNSNMPLGSTTPSVDAGELVATKTPPPSGPATEQSKVDVEAYLASLGIDLQQRAITRN